MIAGCNPGKTSSQARESPEGAGRADIAARRSEAPSTTSVFSVFPVVDPGHLGQPGQAPELTLLPVTAIEGSMSRRLSHALAPSRLLLALLAAGLMAALGLGVTATADGADDPCGSGCPCDGEAGAADEVLGHGDESAPCEPGSTCPAGDGGDGCPAGCSHCACCPGVGAAVLPPVTVRGAAAAEETLRAPPLERPANGSPSRIYIPPERSPSALSLLPS
jgi:hypothetical protein